MPFSHCANYADRDHLNLRKGNTIMAGRPKGQISFERHVEIGNELKRIRGLLVTLAVEIGNAYPVTGQKGKAYRALGKAYSSIDQVRSELEERMYEEYPQEANTHIYYGESSLSEATSGKNSNN